MRTAVGRGRHNTTQTWITTITTATTFECDSSRVESEKGEATRKMRINGRLCLAYGVKRKNASLEIVSFFRSQVAGGIVISIVSRSSRHSAQLSWSVCVRAHSGLMGLCVCAHCILALNTNCVRVPQCECLYKFNSDSIRFSFRYAASFVVC